MHEPCASLQGWCLSALHAGPSFPPRCRLLGTFNNSGHGSARPLKSLAREEAQLVTTNELQIASSLESCCWILERYNMPRSSSSRRDWTSTHAEAPRSTLRPPKNCQDGACTLNLRSVRFAILTVAIVTGLLLSVAYMHLALTCINLLGAPSARLLGEWVH